MTVQQIIEDYKLKQIITPEIAYTIQDSEDLGKELVTYFRTHKNRSFTLALLLEFTTLRKSGKPLSGDTIMLGCYLLGLHGEVEDSLTIWNAKTADFDTYCYVDIQLAVFAGVNETIAYLGTQTQNEAGNALQYIQECKKCGDFDNLENYFNPEKMPWFV